MLPSWTAWHFNFNMGLKICPETSITNNQRRTTSRKSKYLINPFSHHKDIPIVKIFVHIEEPGAQNSSDLTRSCHTKCCL